jgi:arylsulfatase
MQKKIEARKMELYAGMVENLDFHIGRLLAHLKSIGEYENTMIVFVSDNGAAAAEFYSEASIKSFLDATYDNSYENMGSPSSFVYYDKPWAEASSALFRNHKQYTYEGGIRVPAIIKYPNNEEPNGIHHDFSTVADLAPTFYEVAGITYPEHYEGQQLYPLQGKSLIPLLSEGLREIHDPDETWVMEHNHHILVRQGAWKLVNPALGPEVANFSLFNLETDLIESEDLKTRYPEKFKELMSYWNEFKKNNHIQEIPLENQE